MTITNKIQCDVLIIGGGPAGSSCARALTAKGLSIIVMDKSEFPRDKVCAGWITPPIIKMLDIDVEHYRQHNHCHAIKGFRTGLGNKTGLLNQYDHIVSYSIRRTEFDNYLLQRSGAKTILGEPAREFQRVDNGWLVNGYISTRMLVGAGGYFCPVAKLLGADVGKNEHAVRAQEIEFEMSEQEMAQCQLSSEIPELFFCDDLKGYGWCVRKDNYLNIGLGREDPHHLSQHVNQFVAQLKQDKLIPESTPGKFHGHAYLTYPQSPRRLVDDAALLIGDSAGLAYDRSGEGIRTAVESGLMAAETIAKCQGNYSQQNLLTYEQIVTQRYGEKVGEEKSLLSENLRKKLAKFVLNNRYLSRALVIDRWFLHAHQKPLKLQR